MITLTLPVLTGKMIPCPDPVHVDPQTEMRYQTCATCHGKTFSPDEIEEQVDVSFTYQERTGVKEGRSLTIPGVGRLTESHTRSLARLLATWDNNGETTVRF